MSMYINTAHNIPLPEGISREGAFEIMTINFLRGISSIKGLQVIDQILQRDNAEAN